MSVLSGVLQPDRHAPVAPADKARGPAERAQVRDAHELQDANVNKRGTSSTDYYREQGTNDDHHATIRSAAARPLQEPHSLQTLLLLQLLSINREEEQLQSTVPFDVYPPDNNNNNRKPNL